MKNVFGEEESFEFSMVGADTVPKMKQIMG